MHTHTTLSPDTFQSLEKYASAYLDFVRVRSHSSKPCCAEMVNGRGEVLRIIEDDAYHGATRIKACDEHGVKVQVLSPTPMMIPDFVEKASDAAEVCKILNDDNLRLAALFPERFVAIGALPMQHCKEALQELDRLKSQGVKGVEINSNIDGQDLDAPKYFPIFEALAELDMGVFLHPWGGFMKPQEQGLKERMNPTRNWRPWLAAMPLETALAFDALCRGKVHERLPHLRVLYAHGGGAFPALLGRLEHGSYCRPDLFCEMSQQQVWHSVRDCGVYTDTLTHNPWALKMLTELLGSRRIAVGSDYPYPLGEIDPFDPSTGLDPKKNQCPYPETKKIYPGHMVEHLPSSLEDMKKAWEHFSWLGSHNADGERDLPLLSPTQKDNMLCHTAKLWLGL